MRWILTLLCLVVVAIYSCAATAGDSATETSARQGFEQILDIWRAEDYEGLFARLEHSPERGWGYFAERIVHAARVPACCWAKIREVKVTVVTQDLVILGATVGFEVEGVGIRYVTRDFRLRRSDGVWKLPLEDVLELSDYSWQRIPRKVYERRP